MGIRLDDKGGYEDLKEHVGHDVVVVAYKEPGSKDEPVNVAIECETCGVVLISFDKP